jgi:ribulose-5-phosphate 4-epimerase/fuculose-1-phosphate aldolase
LGGAADEGAIFHCVDVLQAFVDRRKGGETSVRSVQSIRGPETWNWVERGIVTATSEGERIGKALGPHKAVILRNHGLLTVGETVDEAVWWFITMERSCQSQLLAEAAGNPIKISPENATRSLVRNSGPSWLAGFNFSRFGI